MGQNRKKLPCPKIRIFHCPTVIDFGQNLTLRLLPNHGRELLGSILGPMGSHWGKKLGQNPKKITMPQNSVFQLPGGHRFRPKLDLSVMARNHGGDPLGSIFGLMGSHWVKKLGQNPKKLPCPKIGFFGYPAVIDFGQNLTVRLWCQIMVGNFKGPSWGQWGPIGAKNWVKTVKFTKPKNSYFRLSRGHRFQPKLDLTVMAPNHGGDPLGSILGPMGSHWS